MHGVLSGKHNLVCLLCLGSYKSQAHLFLCCPVADSVLRRILDWLHLNPIAFTDLLEDHLLHFYVQIKGRCPKGLGFFYGCPLFGLFSL